LEFVVYEDDVKNVVGDGAVYSDNQLPIGTIVRIRIKARDKKNTCEHSKKAN
jgi:hypothetical protein